MFSLLAEGQLSVVDLAALYIRPKEFKVSAMRHYDLLSAGPRGVPDDGVGYRGRELEGEVVQVHDESRRKRKSSKARGMWSPQHMTPTVRW